MSALPLALAAELGDRLRVSTPVESLTREGRNYAIHTAQGKQIDAERVILASPAFAQANILQDLAPNIAKEIDAIPYPSLSVCCLGYKRDKITCYYA